MNTYDVTVTDLTDGETWTWEVQADCEDDARWYAEQDELFEDLTDGYTLEVVHGE